MSGFEDEEPVLGAPPAMPDDVWDRVLSSTFEADIDDDAGADLLPQDEPLPADETGSWDADLGTDEEPAGDYEHDSAHDWDTGDHGL